MCGFLIYYDNEHLTNISGYTIVNMPQIYNKPKNKKSAKKASSVRARSPSPFSDSDSGGDQVQAFNAGGQAVASPDSRSRAASPDSRSRASSPENVSRFRASSHSRVGSLG
jgi:hypothetical protein